MKFWRRRAFYLVVGALVFGAILGAGGATAYWPGFGQWARDFTLSPALAALGAIGAALIALTGITRQADSARRAASLSYKSAGEALAHTKAESITIRERENSLDSQNAWWRSFDWITTQATQVDRGRIQLPTAKLIQATQSLLPHTVDDAQRLACASVVDALIQKYNEDQEASRAETQEVSASQTEEKAAPTNWIPDFLNDRGETYESVVDAITHYVSSAKGTAAQSGSASYFLYEAEVLKALREEFDVQTGARIRIENGGSPFPVDAVIRGAGPAPVVVDVVYVRNARTLRDRVRRAYDALFPLLGEDVAVVIVAPFPLDAELTELVSPLHFAHWDSPNDSKTLFERVRSAAYSKR